MKTGKKYTFKELMDSVRASTHSAENNWIDLELELELNDKISQLSDHTAPKDLWDAIDKEINEEPQGEAINGKNTGSFIFLVVGILIGITAFALFQYAVDKGDNDEFKYDSEIEIATLEHNSIEVDENVSEILRYIENNSAQFDKEQLIEFNLQLEDINRALKEFIELQNIYGLDESSKKQMAIIEKSRLDLLKSMDPRF